MNFIRNGAIGLIALVLCTGCRTGPTRPVLPTVPRAPVSTGGRALLSSSSFITTFWCGPPLPLFDDARAIEIAGAGFTIVGPPCEGEQSVELTRHALDVAARHGLTMWVSDPRFDEHAPERPGWEAALDAAVADYRNRPGFGGYFVTDEPVVGQFASLAAVVARLRAADPDHLAYVNLLADYAITGAGASSYHDYVEHFVTTVRPALLSYDYYPFGVPGDRPTFFTSLALMRDVSEQYHIPFMLIVLAMPHGPYRDPTEAELRWQVFHAMAYGARGISYFAYWTPVDVEYGDVMKFRHGLIENGRPTRHYEEAVRVNRVARALAGELDGWRSVGVADSVGEVAAAPPLGPIEAIEGGAVTAGLFEHEDGRMAILLVNRNYRQAVSVRLGLRSGARPPVQFDPNTLTWTGRLEEPIRLAAGGAALLKWNR